jgi:hypothetical protein
VCTGTGSAVSLRKVTLSGTPLVVLNGARVSLEACHLTGTGGKGICLYAHGAGTHVQLNRCKLEGGLQVRQTCMPCMHPHERSARSAEDVTGHAAEVRAARVLRGSEQTTSPCLLSCARDLQGAAVHAQATVHATRSTFTAAEVTGIEVKDPGSALTLAERCAVRDMGLHLRGGRAGYWCRALYIHADAQATLTDVELRNVEWAMQVRLHAHACSCGVAAGSCMLMHAGARGAVRRGEVRGDGLQRQWREAEPRRGRHSHTELDHRLRPRRRVGGTREDAGDARRVRSVRESAPPRWSCGLARAQDVSARRNHALTRAHACRCAFARCAGCGCGAEEAATLAAASCTTAGCGTGFMAQNGASLRLQACRSTRDGTAVRVHGRGSVLRARDVRASESRGVGFCASGGARADLASACAAVGCQCSGVQANDAGTRVSMAGGAVEGNAQCGLVVWKGAEADAHSVVSSGNGRAGFGSTGSGSRLWLTSCSGARPPPRCAPVATRPPR